MFKIKIKLMEKKRRKKKSKKKKKSLKMILIVVKKIILKNLKIQGKHRKMGKILRLIQVYLNQ